MKLVTQKMASNTQTVPKLLRNLRDNGKTILQSGALTYIWNNAEKLEKSSAIGNAEYAEICGLVMDIATRGDQNTRNEAIKALHSILKHFRQHDLKFFESSLGIDRDKRSKIFLFLEAVDDTSFIEAINDPLLIDFIEDCLISVETNSMPWLSPTSCTENLQLLQTFENRELSNAEEIEELIACNALNLLRRIYKIGTYNAESPKINKLDLIVMEKAIPLAYLGHKRQRGPAICLVNQAIEAEMPRRVKIAHSDSYSNFKKNIQECYSQRMTLLLKSCEPDWANLWSISIRMLGTDLHRGAPLINKLLSVEEKAFKSTDTTVRKEAFVSWKLLIDNLALDMKQLATQRRVKLICVPLIANNSKSEVIALKKLEVWWYLISKLYSNITPFADPIVTQFLNFCFGPLGDTPLLSTKTGIIASPGKRFYRSKIIAIDALIQLLAIDQKDRRIMTPLLEERLPNAINEGLFKQCYKLFLHSVAEAVLIISKFNNTEMKNREEIRRILWMNLMQYIRTSDELKTTILKELILVISEFEIDFISDFLRDVVIPEFSTVAHDLNFPDRTLIDFMTLIMVPSFLKNLQAKQCEAVKVLMWQTVKPEASTQFNSETMEFLYATLSQLRSIPVDIDGPTDCFELWFAYAEIIYKFMKAPNDINEGTETKPNFKTIEATINFPFTHMYWANSMLAQRVAVHWKDIYKKYESQADMISSTKPNEIVETTSKMIDSCLIQNETSYRIAAHCLDALVGTINYKVLLAQNKISMIVRLVNDVTATTIHKGQVVEAECALKAFSSMLITIYGHSPEKIHSYMVYTIQTVELMLKTDVDDALVKEVLSTWETIVSILRGLGNLLTETFLQSYKNVILLSLQHSNPKMGSQTRTILDVKDSFKESVRTLLIELFHENKKPAIRDYTRTKLDKAEKTPKSPRIAGSFLGRTTASSRTIGRKEEERKLSPLPPDPDSQDYVIINSNLQLDVNRLTEHQKEIFKRRRDDIPAMYNDLSQSSSQDSQDLQKWFVNKTKSEDTEKLSSGGKSEVEEKIVQNDRLVNSEKNNSTKDDRLSNSKDDKSIETQKDSEKKNAQSTQEKASTPQNPDTSVASNSSTLKNAEKSTVKLNDDFFFQESNLSKSNSHFSDPLVGKKLDFESHDEYPDETSEADKSSDLLLTIKTKLRTKISSSDEKNKISTSTIQKNQRKSEDGKISQPQISSETKLSEVNSRESSSQPQSSLDRGLKRKASETDDEAGAEKKRKKSPSSQSELNEDSESSSEMKRRTRWELSRLRIDMVLDGPVTSRRRSKHGEDNAGETSRETSPTRKNLRAKGNRSRGLSNLKKLSKVSESEEVPKKRRKKGTKEEEEEKAESKQESENIQGSQTTKTVKNRKSKKNVKEIGRNPSESQIIVDDETLEDGLTKTDSELSENSENRVKTSETEEKGCPEVFEASLNENAENETPMENVLDEVVESSQDSTVLTGSYKKSFILILKKKSTDELKSMDHVADSAQPTASSPITALDKPTRKASLDENAPDDPDETFLDISAIRPQLADEVPMEEEKKMPEASKTTVSPVSIKSTETNLNFSSPKGPKRCPKMKSFAPQGRAAHMLGLVTKLANLEKDGQIDNNQIEEEIITMKRMRTKEIDGDSSKKDRMNTIREPERIGSPSGSRQEKIFNNMRTGDYAASPPGKLFSNLKNNGEKISPKMEKSQGAQEIGVSVARDEEANVLSEKDELPILEWSSANPPSLSASPSVSILKRSRSLGNEIEVDPTTPNRSRKRVSFADPPVSKEMGYEVEAGSSPHKIKFGRAPLVRRDSPIRMKQSRLMMIQVEPDKIEKPNEQLLTSDMDLHCEKENEILMKIAEELEDAIEYQENERTEIPDVSENPLKNKENEQNVMKLSDICQELEITSEKEGQVEEATTQDDLFNSSDEKTESPGKMFVPGKNQRQENSTAYGPDTSVESIRLNVTDDSAIGNVTDVPVEETNGQEDLEDTIDVQNMPSMNSTGNSEEVFGDIPVRSSTHVPDSMCEMDTLPVTDSLLTTQDSQGTQLNAEIPRPELLNSTDAIYPSLNNCRSPIEEIVDNLTNPLWRKNLMKYLETRCIRTVGDLAKLSEREIMRIPVKGSSKVDFVKNVLRRFEQKLRECPEEKRIINELVVRAPEVNILQSREEHELTENELNELPQEIRRTLGDISALAGISKNNTEFASTLDAGVLGDSQATADFSSSDQLDELDPPTRTSTANAISTIVIDSSTERNEISSVLNDSTISQMGTINLCSTIAPNNRSVGTEMDIEMATKSVETEAKIEDILDHIDVNVLLKSVIRRIGPEKLLEHYKEEKQNISETELCKEVVRILGIGSDTLLRLGCLESGLKKVLYGLPNIFYKDEHSDC